MANWGNGRGGRPWRRLVEAVKRRDQFICQICGRLNEDGEVDHRIPQCKGGKSAMDNLQWLCREPCHQRKTLVESGVKLREARMERRKKEGDHWSR